MAFVFYDTETTGTHTSFDQILQFAAIKTDVDLNEVGRFEMRCRLLPHIVPHPGALVVTGVTIDQLTDPSTQSHYEMMCRICETLSNWSPAVFMGWNTLTFDERLLRQALYQCLHPPYLTNTGGSGRADLMKVAQALSVLQPEALVVPTGPNGQPTYKLDRLAPANGFDHLNAHDALADVEATIHICRLIRERAPEVWSNALTFSSKAAVSNFIDSEAAFVLIESYFNRLYQFALTRIGVENGTVYALDLTINPESLTSLSDEALRTRLSRSPKPVRRIRANAAPILTRVDAEAGHAGVSSGELFERAMRIQDDRELCERLIEAVATEERAASEHVEEQIYDRFVSGVDEARMRAFHAASWTDRVAIVEQFEDPRLVELGRRLIFLNRPDVMCEEDRASHELMVARRISGHGYASPVWTTLARAEADAKLMLEGCLDSKRAILEGIMAYIAERSRHCETLLSV